MTTLQGDANANELSGGNGDDLIYGRGGNDSLWGGDSGTDAIYGGAGDDMISDGKGDAADILDGGAGFDTLSMFYGAFFGGGISGFNWTFVAGADMTTPGGSSASGFERVSITGSDYGDTITGGRFDDMVRGWMGADLLDGGRGSDFMVGDNGVDTLFGGKGNDSLLGGGNDDVLYGGDGDDFIRGGATFDVFQGDDTISGGKGADLLWTGPRTTTLLYDESEQGVYVDLELNVGFGGDAAGDTFDIGGGTRLVGSDFNDYLVGGITIQGGDGDDRIRHSDETKVMTGGAGLDRFIFQFNLEILWERPTVTDFEDGGDKLDLSAIDAKPKAGDQAFNFIGTAALSEAAGEARYEFLDGQTVIQLNVNRGDGVDHTIVLDGEHTLTAADFVL
jgi:Ca2+-binding RTX toxin-like protein